MAPKVVLISYAGGLVVSALMHFQVTPSPDCLVPVDPPSSPSPGHGLLAKWSKWSQKCQDGVLRETVDPAASTSMVVLA
jgi:hypothetical protein